MKALVYDGRCAAFKEDYPLPSPGPGESLVRVILSAVCSTDREIMRGYKSDFTGVMGHEFVAVVEKSDRPELVGRRVVGELNSGCGSCIYCKTGREHHCLVRKVPGIKDKDGCFAHYMNYDSRLLHTVPFELPANQAIYCEPLAAALEIPELVHLKPSQQVAVLGDGRLAFLIAQVVALSGAQVKVFGRHREKLAMFESFAETSLEVNGSFETVIEATGSPSGFAIAEGMTRSMGTLVLKSTYTDQPSIDLSRIVVRELKLFGSRCGPFEPALNLLSKNMLILPDIELYELKDFEKAFASKAFKAGFTEAF